MTEEHPHDDELQPEHTAGFKVGEKKTIDEYNKLGRLHPLMFELTQFSAQPLASLDILIFSASIQTHTNTHTYI